MQTFALTLAVPQALYARVFEQAFLFPMTGRLQSKIPTLRGPIRPQANTPQIVSDPPPLGARDDTDYGLTERLMEGDVTAVADAWKRFVPFVQGLLCRMGHAAEMDDLCQEVFERFFRAVRGIRDCAAVRPFIYGITLRVAKRHQRYRWLRRAVYGVSDAAESSIASEGTAETAFESQQAIQYLEKHLNALGPEARALIIARHVDEMELREIAALFGMSFNTMRRRLDRAWTQLSRRARKDESLAAFFPTLPEAADDV